MRVERRCVINADRDAVWKIVSDPDCYPSFMTNLERWETASEQRSGVGARYTVHWKIGSVPVGGLVEVVEFDDRRDLAWVGITGVNLRGRIRLRDAGDGRTKVTFRLSYQAWAGYSVISPTGSPCARWVARWPKPSNASRSSSSRSCPRR